jgi:Protein of unknown function (DUF1588)/Protein of unknown function (DUF1592)
MWQVMNKGRSSRAQYGLSQSRWRTRVGWVPIGSLAAALIGCSFIGAGVTGCSGGVSGDSEDKPGGGKEDDQDDGNDDTENVVTVDGGVVALGDGGVVDPGEVAAGDGCFSNRDFLATQAWKGVVESKCLSCHGPGGIAEAQSAKFTIKPAAYPGFLESNLAELEDLSKTSFDGVSVLLSKATGKLEHGGGQVIAEGSEEFAMLEQLVERGIAGDTCEDPVAVPTFDDVEMLSPELTWRKLTLNLAGRLPSSAESETLWADGEAALPGLLSNLMKEEAFYDRIVEMFNDQWLTDAYIRNSNGVLNGDQFPNLATYYEEMDDANKEAARRSIAREPLQLIAYIVKNERPFTEIVTADYTVLNSYTAPIYNNDDVGFTGTEYNEETWVAGKIFVNTEDGMVALPHAGILSSPIFLNRYPTSRTNLNRHRASTVLRELLATDILKVADRPIDPTKAVNLANPTREEASCKMCHVTIDPIAGAFQKFDDNDYERYQPEREWPTEMFLPGFADDQMQVTDYPDALRWLGQHIAADERFPLAVVRNMYERLMGQKPEDFPEDPSGAAYVGWADQDQTIRAISKEFVDSKYNLKTVISALALSPYYRATQATSDSEVRLAQLWDLGTGRLLSPELLHRKMDGDRGMLTNSLNILYGGIDSQSVTERLQTPNGIMSAVMWRMANEVSCAVVPMDFAKAADKRLLFKDVTIETIPEDALGEIDAKGKAAIEKNIAALYTRLFGEAPAVDSAEFARAYDLFVSTWKVGRNELAFENGDRYLPWECRYRRATGAAEDLPEDQRFELDENYTVRSWMAVMTYMLSDFRFLYD